MKYFRNDPRTRWTSNSAERPSYLRTGVEVPLLFEFPVAEEPVFAFGGPESLRNSGRGKGLP